MTETKRIDEKTWMFEEEGVRFFLLIGEKRAMLIDSGMHTDNAKELAKEITSLPISLINTHADPDHIACNGEFDVFYMHPSECVNYYGKQKRTGSFLPVWDGQCLDLGGRQLRVIAMPGHTPGSIALLDVGARRLFSGDPVQDGRIFMFGEGREMHAYIHSLKRLNSCAGEFDVIYPSHGSCPLKPPIIQKLIVAAEDILSGRASGTSQSFFGKSILAYDMGAATFLCNAVGD